MSVREAMRKVSLKRREQVQDLERLRKEFPLSSKYMSCIVKHSFST